MEKLSGPTNRPVWNEPVGEHRALADLPRSDILLGAGKSARAIHECAHYLRSRFELWLHELTVQVEIVDGGADFLLGWAVEDASSLPDTFVERVVDAAKAYLSGYQQGCWAERDHSAEG